MSQTYDTTRGRLAAYFDGTANEAWKRMMSDAPVSRIRQTVRLGRDAMRAALLDHLPADLRGARILDAGCGAGQLSMELARRGAVVVGADISPRLLEMAQSTTPADLAGQITYRAGDMLDPAHGRFDFAVAMDSLIHYGVGDIARALATLADRTGERIVFTVAPRTPALSLMHSAGKLFPRQDRSPAIVPVTTARLRHETGALAGLDQWRLAEGRRVKSGFYISQAMELARS